MACWEVTQIWNQNVSTISLTKTKLGLKFPCIIPHAFVRMKGTTTNSCIFTMIITKFDRHFRDASNVCKSNAHEDVARSQSWTVSKKGFEIHRFVSPGQERLSIHSFNSLQDETMTISPQLHHLGGDVLTLDDNRL